VGTWLPIPLIETATGRTSLGEESMKNQTNNASGGRLCLGEGNTGLEGITDLPAGFEVKGGAH
jgi:hypothetical protein